MRIAYCSDLHVDFWCREINPQNPKALTQIMDFIKNEIIPVPADVLIIAGDIGHYNNQNFLLLTELKKIYNHVLIVYGNHDMYLVSTSVQNKFSCDSSKRITELKEFCDENEIVFFNGQVIEIDGVKFGGTPMWYDLPTEDDVYDWKKKMNDARLIQSGLVKTYNSFDGMYGSPVKNVISTFKTQEFYEEQKEILTNMNECDVFISHVIPIIFPERERDKKHVQSSYNKFYESDNIELIKKIKAKVCIFGHSHQKSDFMEDEIRFVSSAIGYPSEKNARMAWFSL